MLNVMSFDQSDFSTEMLFMLAILREDIILDEDMIKQYTSKIDRDLFLKLVMHHRVYPLVYEKLNKFSPGLILEDTMKALQLLNKKNIVKMLELTRELGIVCRLFADQGIRSIVLKGPVLAVQLYGELSLRTSKDLDILIDTNDVDRAKDVLKQLGYHTDKSELHVYWKKKSHHLSFSHPSNIIQIEIHWRLNPDIVEPPSFEQLWKNKKIVKISSQEFNQLGNEDLLAYLADHGARHGWFRLRWLLDIDRLVKNPIDVAYLNNYYKQYGGRIYVEQAFLLSKLLLSSNIPQNIRSQFDAKSFKLAQMALQGIKDSLEVGKGYNSQYKRSIISALTVRQKTLLILKRLLPSSLDADLLPLSKRYFFLYFPLRPFLWFWRLMKRT